MIKNDTTLKQKNENVLFLTLVICLCITTFVVRLFHLDTANHIICIPDEFAYWAHSANIAGLNWTKVTRSWYSYGYSLFILPFFLIFNNTVSIYKAIIISNSFLAVLNVILGYKVILEFFENKVNKYMAILISFIAFNFSAYLLQSQIAWSESLQYSFYILIIYLMILFLKKPSYIKTFFITLLSTYLYIIHNRNMGVYIALIIILVIMLIFKHINYKHLLIAFATIGLCFLFDKYMRSYVMNLMWNSASDIKIPNKQELLKTNTISDYMNSVNTPKPTKASFSGNSLQSVLSRINVLSIDFWINLLISYAGKIWANLTSTFLISFFGVSYLFRNIFSGIKNKKWDLKNNFCLFILLTIAAAFTAVSIYNMTNGYTFALNGVRADTLVYTRYTDILGGILIILGLCSIFTEINNKKFFIQIIIAVVFYIIMFLLAFLDFSYVESGNFVAIHVPSLLIFKNFDMRFYTLKVIGIFLLIYFSSLIFRKNSKYVFVMVYIVVAMVFFNLSYNRVYEGYVKLANEDIEQYNPGINLMKNYKNTPICLYGNNVNDPIRNVMMSGFFKEKVYHDVETVPSNNYFVVSNNTTLKQSDYPEGTKFVWKVYKFIIGVHGEDLQQKLMNDGIYLSNETSRGNYYELEYQTQGSVSEEEGIYTIYPKSTVIVDRPNINKGKFQFIFDLDTEPTDEIEAYVTTKMGTQIVKKIDDLKKGLNEVDFELKENDWSLDLKVVNNTNNEIKLKYVYLKDN